jgi:uncharacterized protein (DUF2345 family)
VGYKALFINRNTAPNAPIPNWVSASNYEENDLVFSGGIVYQCTFAISGSTTPPTPVSDPNWNDTGITANTITNIWTTEVPFASTITGDNFSTITIGAIDAPVDFVRVDGDGFVAGGTTAGLEKFNYVDLVAQTGSDATIYFNDSANALQAKIFTDNTAKRLTIQSDTGLTINSTGATTTDFSAGVVEDLKTLTLTSTIFTAWNDATSYGDGAEVEYDNGNWVSQFAGNLGNIPNATLQNWVSGEAYAVGNVRYYATNNKAYLCNTAITLGTTTPPPSDAKWTEFQTGSNGEDVFFPSTAPVVSTIVGDRVSGLQIGNITCVGDVGSYLEITANPENNADGIIQSTGGGLGLAGATGISVVSLTGTATIASLDDVIITGAGGVAIGSDAGNITLNAPAGTITLSGDLTTTISSTANDVDITSTLGDVDITAGNNVNIDAGAGTIDLTSDLTTSITSGNAITLSSQEATNITSTANNITLTGSTGVSLTSPDAITLTSSTTDVIITSTLGDVDITAGNNVNIDAGAGTITLTSDLTTTISSTSSDVNIDANTTMGLTSVGEMTLASTTGDVVISANTGADITTLNGSFNIDAVNGGMTIAGNTGITLNSGDGSISLNTPAGGVDITTSSSVNIVSDSDVNITTGGNVAVMSNAGAVNLSSATEAVITSGDYMTIQAEEQIELISNINTISLLGATGVEITATANDVNIISSAGVGITTIVGGNVEINTYYPPLTIYKNATIGSAVSRAANTAEVQVYPQTYTLKANTQYLLNMTYSGLTENASTATPNNNWYIIYRVHPSTTLTTSNLIGVAQVFNNTQIGAGQSVPFMTTTAGTYTGRFYIRNQNATVALTIANISATITEVF